MITMALHIVGMALTVIYWCLAGLGVLKYGTDTDTRARDRGYKWYKSLVSTPVRTTIYIVCGYHILCIALFVAHSL